ncbi:MAG: 3-dehydroquinate synthase [Solobacterium sp.]|jgi:3-dehydroquinate synthase|nr:3-dehydroquinate synthase [Solobacterium sp.]
METVKVHTRQRDYDIVLGHGILKDLKQILGSCGRVFVISDDGVPKQYMDTVQAQYPDMNSFVFAQGEQSKNMNIYQQALSIMLKERYSRNDTVIALGGGVPGDLAGFVAASYMRGVRFVNIPTTVLSQIDSSIGGKTAIDMDGIKNCVGAFWQPSLVLIDPDTLKTLPKRQISNGLAEAVKEGVTSDPILFHLFEQDDYMDHLDEIILRCLEIKKGIVERDERESGERKLLNFGHTYGHAYESYEHGQYYHGECVAMGMMTIVKNQEVKDRLRRVLQRLDLPLACDADDEAVISLIEHDKKADHDHVTIVQADQIGRGHLENWTMQDIRKGLEQ